MDNNDFIREVRNFMDRFFAEWLILNNEYEKSITKDLEEMEKKLGMRKESFVISEKDEVVE